MTYQSNDTLSIADFDMLRSSPLSSPNDQNHSFLTNTVNWDPISTRQISTKVKEIESVCQVIHTHFNLKARQWQVNTIIDITKRKRDICAVAGISAGKNLVYQLISVVTGGSIFVISPTIAIMED